LILPFDKDFPLGQLSHFEHNWSNSTIKYLTDYQ
jgi:hypothetical protein